MTDPTTHVDLDRLDALHRESLGGADYHAALLALRDAFPALIAELRASQEDADRERALRTGTEAELLTVMQREAAACAENERPRAALEQVMTVIDGSDGGVKGSAADVWNLACNALRSPANIDAAAGGA